MATFTDLAALDPVANSKGQKNAVIVRDGQNAFWTLSSAVTPIWQPSAFKGISGESNGKLSLCVNGDPDVMSEAASLDNHGVRTPLWKDSHTRTGEGSLQWGSKGIHR